MDRLTDRGGGLARRLGDFREFMIIAIILASCAFMCVVSPTFRTPDNLWVILLAVATQAIVAIGMTILLISGGFDLSVGSTAGLAAAAAGLAMVGGVPVPAAVLLGLAVGAAVGLTNGLLVARVGINPFITTLGMMGVVRGLLEIVTQGKNVSGLPESFKWIGQGTVLGVQHPIIICLVLVAIGDLLLRKSRFLRQNYYIGGSEKAALLSGINVNRMKIFNYVLTGVLAAVAGMITAARFGNVSVTLGKNLELQVITAVIIGGASLQGGEGTVLGALLGSLLMAIIITAINIFHVDIYWNTFIIGATLLVAVLIDVLSKRKRNAV
ncbi:MAG: ABC transporter permease [Planctomycetota bacterium]|nr:ABC transporter permease [Planctomycetota bacterium]